MGSRKAKHEMNEFLFKKANKMTDFKFLVNMPEIVFETGFVSVLLTEKQFSSAN